LISPNYRITFVSGTLTVLGPGTTLLGTALFIVGGTTTSDLILVQPAGTSPTGSTGVAVAATLNGVRRGTTFLQAVTDVAIFGYNGNESIILTSSLMVNATITAGNGHDNVQAGNATVSVTLGDGDDTVQLGNGNNTVTLGNGNDTVLLGSGNNVLVTGDGTNFIQAGDGDNLIAAGLGKHTMQVGNGSNILIDGTVALTQSGDTLHQVLSDWIQSGKAAAANIRARLAVTYNSSHANTLTAGSGLDWFWETYSQDKTNRKATDLLN
jgi:Ca2+-binding RTX toxin-like protein